MAYAHKQFINGFRNEFKQTMGSSASIYPRTEDAAFELAKELKSSSERQVKCSWYGMGQMLAYEYLKNGKF